MSCNTNSNGLSSLEKILKNYIVDKFRHSKSSESKKYFVVNGNRRKFGPGNPNNMKQQKLKICGTKTVIVVKNHIFDKNE